MALSFLYQLVQRLLGLVRDHRRDALSKDAEILVLRPSHAQNKTTAARSAAKMCSGGIIHEYQRAA